MSESRGNDATPSSAQTGNWNVSPERAGLPAWLRWCLVALTVGFLGVASSCVACAVTGYRAQGEGAAFARDSIVAVTRPWSAEALVQRASPDLLQHTPADKLHTFIAFVAKRLGPLKTLGTIQNGPWHNFAGTSGTAVFTWHHSDCDFERGPGRISVQLVRRGGEWKILTFNVNSDLLMQDQP